MAYSASGMLIHAANAFAPKYITAVPTAPIGKRSDSEVRNDTGVYEGGEISMYYDPMVAKLCTWAPTRLDAIDAMADALDDFEVEGIGHNLPFLSAVMGNERFRAGRGFANHVAAELLHEFHEAAAGKAGIIHN